MADKSVREIVLIDPDKCDGCGLCIPSCAEGAIELIDGKAVLSADNLCDGLGNCLGVCPKDAITIEHRQADAFDEAAVEQHLTDAPPAEPAGCPSAAAGPSGPKKGCPGSMLRKLAGGGGASAPAAGPSPSRLEQWPVQLTLLPEKSDLWNGADVLIAADCAAFAMGDFHQRLLPGKTLAIACPKLDDPEAYIEKLARIFAANTLTSITVARMEVPCCGLDVIVRKALEAAEASVPLTIITLSVAGEMLDINGVAVAG